MSKKPAFTWERPPFLRCPMCDLGETFGILSAGGDSVTRRCVKCRFSHSEKLPALDKRVIYLDQFAFSELFKLKSGNRRTDAHTDFWVEADQLITRVLLLQQAIFPASEVHHSETIVSAWPVELRHAYEAMGGDVRLEDTNIIQLRQVRAFADAYISGTPVALDFDIDSVIRGKRNAWLTDMRISLSTDYSQFADATRASVAETAGEIANLMAQWRRMGYGFDEVLEIELGSYQASRLEALAHFAKRHQEAVASGDFMAELNVGMSSIVKEMSLMRDVLSRAGVPVDRHDEEINGFWCWEGNRDQPFGRILAYMFAALAGQVKAGRIKPPTPGFMNDVKVLGAYAPYVDAMFVDNECATLLSQGRPRDELTYRARIFSLNTKNDFLEYLKVLEASASGEVRRQAESIYGA